MDLFFKRKEKFNKNDLIRYLGFTIVSRDLIGTSNRSFLSDVFMKGYSRGLLKELKIVLFDRTLQVSTQVCGFETNL